jgi:hypothetical protein
MTTKKQAEQKQQKQGNKEVQLDIDPTTKIEALEEKLTAQDGVILALRELLEEKEGRIIQLGTVIDVQSEDLDNLAQQAESNSFTALESIATQSLRTTMLMAMLPQVRLDYAHSDAQKAVREVNVIMEVWGISDED